MWPVIVRELRSASRGHLTYWLRLLGAAAACAAALIAGGLELGGLELGGRDHGQEIFGALHILLFCAIWVLVPAVAADCLSRERREGTLGLLFLTPLKPMHIAIAKSLIQTLRALTLGLAIVPVLLLPILMGGVTRDDALICLLINGTSFCWALGAGIWVSARSTAFHRSMLAAVGLAIVFALILAFLNCVFGMALFAPRVNISWIMSVPIGFMVLGSAEVWQELARDGKFSNWLWGLAVMFVLSWGVLWMMVRHAARRLHATWQTSAVPGRWATWQRRLCTPIFFRTMYRRWLQWSLNSNPVGWLERRTWTARSVKWGWLAIMCAFYGFVLVEDSFNQREFTEMQMLAAAALTLSAAFSASGSFRRERDNGVLSLLLVSPLRVKHIVTGRLRALWGQYLPAAGLLFGAWLYLSETHGQQLDFFMAAYFAACFLALPVIGLYCSLWRQTFFGALSWTVVLSFVLPIAVSDLLSPLSPFPDLPYDVLVAAAAQLGVALACLGLLIQKLSARSFRLPAG